MKIANLKQPVASSWLVREGWRLDAAPFLSGKVEALLALEKIPTERLADLTHGQEGGIFRRPQHNRHWVSDPAYGVPYLGSSDILLADLTHLPLLKRTFAESPRLACLRLKEGMTLISASGTIGRTVYCRPEMDGMWSSEDVMKVVPDPEKIPPGYVFAFLKSKYGSLLVTAGTYGAIIQHIEPEHLSDLPVPRLGKKFEKNIHIKIDRAAKLRSKSSELFSFAEETLHDTLKIPRPSLLHSYNSPLISSVSSGDVTLRFDAHFFNKRALDSRVSWDRVPNIPLLEAAEVWIPNIFKRRYAPDKSFGYPYLTGGDVFTLMPEFKNYLLRPVAENGRLLLKKGMVVVQDSGQVGGLIGQSVIIGQQLHGYAATNNMVRILAKDVADAGFIFALLRSEHGRRLLEREATGTSIPHLDESRVEKIPIPWPDRAKRQAIATIIDQAVEIRDQAAAFDLEAITEIESEIEGARG